MRPRERASVLLSRALLRAAPGVAAAAVWGAGALGALGVMGCASGVPVRSVHVGGDAGRDVGIARQGEAWETVFLPAGTAASLVNGGPEGRAEYARRDEGLTVRPAEVMLATAQWPTPERTSVERTRRIQLPENARSVLFFLPKEREWGRWRERWYWGEGRWY